MTTSIDDRDLFLQERQKEICHLGQDTTLHQLTSEWFNQATRHRYSYHFDWLGLPIIQYPQDIIAIQEIIWKTKPNIIIETGIARGGSLIFNASMLHLLNNKGRVIGIDIDIRAHNREAIEKHPLSERIHLIQGSSIESDTLLQIKHLIQPTDKVMVILDSNHTYEHVLTELMLYSPLVTQSCYLIVLDTVIKMMDDSHFVDRPWDNRHNNPHTAVDTFLQKNNRFIIDYETQNKLLITVAPNGYLKCIL